MTSPLPPAHGKHLSAETTHASAVAFEGRAVLITGASDSGKSDLALRLLDRGFVLVSDDQTTIRREGRKLFLSPPGTIAGKLEVRGIGIVDMEHESDVPLALVVELAGQIQRLPEDSRTKSFLGLAVPVITIDAKTASAPAKVALALDRLGLPA